jgi:hypothetical protein
MLGDDGAEAKSAWPRTTLTMPCAMKAGSNNYLTNASSREVHRHGQTMQLKTQGHVHRQRLHFSSPCVGCDSLQGNDTFCNMRLSPAMQRVTKACPLLRQRERLPSSLIIQVWHAGPLSSQPLSVPVCSEYGHPALHTFCEGRDMRTVRVRTAVAFKCQPS